MTYSSDRLDRIEALLATTMESLAASAQRQIESDERLSRTERIVESNARAIEAWSSRIEDGIAEAEEVSRSMAATTNTRMEEAITDTVQMIANLGTQHEGLERTFEIFLADARQDRINADQRHTEALAAIDQSIKANATEHRAFTQNVQILLAEIARIWQRLAG